MCVWVVARLPQRLKSTYFKLSCPSTQIFFFQKTLIQLFRHQTVHCQCPAKMDFFAGFSSLWVVERLTQTVHFSAKMIFFRVLAHCAASSRHQDLLLYISLRSFTIFLYYQDVVHRVSMQSFYHLFQMDVLVIFHVSLCTNHDFT